MGLPEFLPTAWRLDDKLLENGTELDGFLIDERIHSGGMAPCTRCTMPMASAIRLYHGHESAA